MEDAIPAVIKASVSTPINSFLLFLLDVVLLVAVMVLQGGCLNLFIMYRLNESLVPKFLFLADLTSAIIAIAGMRVTYLYLRKSSQTVYIEEKTEFVYSPKKLLKKFPTSKLGMLPLGYLSWLVYIFTLLLKIVIMYSSGLFVNLKTNDLFGSQTLQLTIGLTSIVFMLFVEGHNWDFVSPERRAYINTVCVSTGLEIFDSVDMLSLLALQQKRQNAGSHGFLTPYDDLIFALIAFNFLLPALALYKLSFPDDGKRSDASFMKIPLPIIHHILHLLLIDIPFFSARVYSWVAYDEDISMFLMKNVYHIILNVRNICPLFKNSNSRNNSRLPPNLSSAKAANEFEDITLNSPLQQF